MPRISVAIPVYEMEGGEKFLAHSLRLLKNQTFKDFEVVVSDNSKNNDLKGVCKKFPTLDINYFKNPIRGMAQNTNAAIKASKGEIIKILYQDDYLYELDSLEEISEGFDSDTNWLVTPCIHTRDGINFEQLHSPNYHEKIIEGVNLIGSPSVVSIRNQGHILFDENLTWVLDCDLYARYYAQFGLPKMLENIGVVIRLGPHQMTNIIPGIRKTAELEYLIKKHG